MSGSTRRWTAGATVFSGRPDPRWEVPSREAERIVALWAASPPAPGPSDKPPPLGYRGCWLRAPDGREWHAGRRVVTSSGDARADESGEAERAILATAPEGALPEGVP